MKSQISPQDYEQISAFLDGEMREAAARNFESRLLKEPELKAALQDMQSVRSLVREMPKVRAPRSFTLSPHIVKERKAGLFTLVALRTMQFSAALSAILLVLVLAGDLLLNRFTLKGALAPAAPPAALDMAAEAPAEVAPAAQALVTVAAMPKGEAAKEREQAPAASPTAALQKEVAPGAPYAATALATSIPANAVTEERIPTIEMEALEAAPPEQALPELAPARPALPAPIPSPIPRATESSLHEEQKDEGVTGQIITASPQAPGPRPPASRMTWISVEIFLAAVMLLSLFLALIIRRNLGRR
jgi:hypothetical protein